MARGDGRGGYRKPPARMGVSGPGRFSKRTDGGVQPIRSPDIDQPGLQYGDRQMLTEAQRIAPLPQASKAGGAERTRGVTGLPASGASLPLWLIESPSNRPNEPVTAGLDMGPGPGSEVLANPQPSTDEREIILEALYATYGNRQALEELQKMRGERAQSSLPSVPRPPAGLIPASGATA